MNTNVLTSDNRRKPWLTVLVILLALLLSLLPGLRANAEPAPAYGIDISHYNTITDPAAIAANGISFAYVKATEGTGYRDPSYADHVAQLRGVGIKVGGYHFADGPDCAAEGRFFRTALDTEQLTNTGALISMLDMETPSLALFADACVRDFYDASGATALLVYGNQTWWSTYLHPDTWGTRKIIGWIARYNGDPGNPGSSSPVLVVHQHTDHGTVPGIVGWVDRDAVLPGHSLAELVLGGPVVPAPTPTPVAAPVPTPLPTRTVHIVVRGDTLSRIAAAWHVPWPAVAAANGLADPNHIYPKERIYRPSTGTSSPTLPARPAPITRIYVVRRGDTLSGIAARLHYPGGWPALARRDRLANANRLHPGQRLAW